MRYLYSLSQIISRVGLEMVPAGSHKPNHGGSIPSPATKMNLKKGPSVSLSGLVGPGSSLCRSSSVGRATAFQAVGRGFEPRLLLIARVAQLVEHNLAKVGVASSNLVIRSQ